MSLYEDSDVGIFAQTSFTPAETEAVVQKVFPYAKLVAKGYGKSNSPPPPFWAYHIRFGFFDVGVFLYQDEKCGHPVGTVLVELAAIEADSVPNPDPDDIDEGGVTLWRKTGMGLDELAGILGGVREHLMGIAAAITYVFREPPQTTPVRGMPKAVALPPGVARNPPVMGKPQKWWGRPKLSVDSREPDISDAVDAFVEAEERKRQKRQPRPLIKPLPVDPKDLAHSMADLVDDLVGDLDLSDVDITNLF